MKPEAIRAVAAAALDRWEAVAAAIDPKYQVAGENVVMLNPRRDDRTRNSFSFNRHTGQWKDFAAGPEVAGADLVSCWAYCHNLTQGPAAEDLASHLSLDPAGLPGAPKRKHEDAPLPAPVPPEALAAIPRFLAWAKANRSATGEHWIVRDTEGQALLLRLRCEVPGERKKVHPCSWSTEKSRWELRGNFAVLFYGLERLQAKPAATVLLVEGEKTADAAQALFPELVALAFMGADTVRKVDLAPVQGREVILWPDADTSGIEAVRTIAARIAQEGGRVRLVDLPEPIKAWVKPGKTEPGGWDLADQAPAGVDLRALLDSAAGPVKRDRAPVPVDAAAYLDSLPPAVQGQDMDGIITDIALKLMDGFNLTQDDTVSLLMVHYNPRCMPPWAEDDLQAAVQGAAWERQDPGYLPKVEKPTAAKVDRLKSSAAPVPAAGTEAPAWPNPVDQGAGGADLGALLDDPTGTPPPVRILDSAAWLQNDPPILHYILEGLLPLGAPAILAAKSNAGKSMIGMQVSMAVATGLGLFGLRGMNAPQKVLFVEMEDDPGEIQRRYRRCLARVYLGNPVNPHVTYDSSAFQTVGAV